MTSSTLGAGGSGKWNLLSSICAAVIFGATTKKLDILVWLDFGFGSIWEDDAELAWDEDDEELDAMRKNTNIFMVFEKKAARV